MGRLEQNARTMAASVDAQLRLARGEPLQKRPVRAKALVSQALEALAHDIDASSARIHTIFDADFVDCDPPTMHVVLVNLIENALKYGRAGGAPEIEISARRSEGAVVLSVADAGRGVDAHQLASLTRFATRGDVKGLPGAGIGLATCARIVDAHAGTLSFHPRRPGLEVRVTLPVAGGESRV